MRTALAVAVAGLLVACAGTGPTVAARTPDDAPRPAPRTGYAPVNGLQLYYELHGTGGRPLVLLHGALSTIDTSFGKVLPALAKGRQVIAVELQGHGHTADIDRPLSYEGMADDVAALLRHLGIGSADVYGYSMGGGVALQVAIRHPALVSKLVVAASSYDSAGVYPEILKGIETLQPEHLAGSPFETAYLKAAPDPKKWPALIGKIKDLDRKPVSWPAESIRAIQSPTLVLIGDADIVRPEHAVEMYRLLGGGTTSDGMGPASQDQLAILPGTSHITLVDRADLLLPILTTFLDAPVPGSR